MYLALYGLGGLGKQDPIPWNAFCSAFSGCEIVRDPRDDRDEHWILKHPAQDIRLYSAVSGLLRKEITSVHFDYKDVPMLWHTDGSPEHPLWEGLFRLLKDWQALLCAEPPGRGTPVAKAVIVARPELIQELPSWADDVQLKFACPTLADFIRVVASGWDLSRDFLNGSEPRSRWADSDERDERALTDFKNFITGKRGASPRYAWDGKPVKPTQSAGSFLDAYGMLIDWRDFDFVIVEYFAEKIANESLLSEEAEDHLRITYQSRTRALSYGEIGKERYNTLRALNEVLSPDYEIRIVKNSHGWRYTLRSVCPTWLWHHLEKECSSQLKKKVKRIGPLDRFV